MTLLNYWPRSTCCTETESPDFDEINNNIASGLARTIMTLIRLYTATQ
jgi:hypothetical protein